MACMESMHSLLRFCTVADGSVVTTNAVDLDIKIMCFILLDITSSLFSGSFPWLATMGRNE